MCHAGDLSVGDPGFSSHSAAQQQQQGSSDAAGGGGEWWSAEGELLSAPHRNNGRGVNYQRSAKQVSVEVELKKGMLVWGRAEVGLYVVPGW